MKHFNYDKTDQALSEDLGLYMLINLGKNKKNRKRMEAILYEMLSDLPSDALHNYLEEIEELER